MLVRFRPFVAVACAGFLSLGAGQAAASSFTVMDLPGFSDQDFNALINGGQFSEDFIAESRSGDAGGAATYEQAILDVTPPGPGGLPATQGQFDWVSGTAYDFSLSFDGTTVTYTLGGQTLNAAPTDGIAINEIYIRTRSNGDGSSFAITDLTFGGEAVGESLLSDDNGTIDYLKISDFSGGFTLTGTQTLSWSGEIPSQSRLAAQFKVGEGASDTEIPVPATLALLLAGLGVLAWMRRPA